MAQWKTARMDATKLVHAASPAIQELGWTYYFVPSTIERGERLGLDMFTFYFLGRGGVLGDVEPAVVAAAFGYFNPSVIENAWNAGRLKVAPRDAGREYFAAAHDYGRDRLGGLELGGFVDAARRIVDAARGRSAGLSLFAGASAEPVPEDDPAAAMHLLAVLREFRGSAHLVAVVAEGVEPKVAHYLRRPGMFGVFGWSEEDTPEVNQEHTDALQRADERTDRLVAPAFGVLDDDQAAALLQGLEEMAPRLTNE